MMKLQNVAVSFSEVIFWEIFCIIFERVYSEPDQVSNPARSEADHQSDTCFDILIQIRVLCSEVLGKTHWSNSSSAITCMKRE